MPRADYMPQMADIPPDQRPAQYPEGRCIECARPLSRYNPYQVCGPCRVKMASAMPGEIAESAKVLEQRGFTWERFPKRKPVVGTFTPGYRKDAYDE